MSKNDTMLPTPHAFINRVMLRCLGYPKEMQAILIDEALVRVRERILVRLEKEEAQHEETP